MKQICVISGKGGTGKSSLSASFAALHTKKLVVADCDVDAANMSLFFNGTDTTTEPFYAGTKGRIDTERCTQCGECIEYCRFGAISKIKENHFIVQRQCEGCHACSVVCPVQAISFHENRSGTLYVRNVSFGPLVHAALGVAQDNSGKLVTSVRNRAMKLAEEDQIDTILIDGPPGIGCPVHASLTGVDLAVVIAEPSISGVHDIERILQLCNHFKIPAKVIINKYDLSTERSCDIEKLCPKYNAIMVGKIPFDKKIPQALCKGKTFSHLPTHARNIQQIWNQVLS